MDDLRNCPFCKGEARVHSFTYLSDTLFHQVRCDDCGAHGHSSELMQEAIDAWNARPDMIPGCRDDGCPEDCPWLNDETNLCNRRSGIRG